MPDRETRYRLVLEVLTAGQSPSQVASEVQRLQQQLEEAQRHLNQTGQQSQAAARAHQEHAQAARELAQQLDAAGTAAYHFGMGAVWSGIPMAQFVGVAGNMTQGLQWMIQGFSELVTRVNPVLSLFVVGGVAATGLAVGMATAARAARDLGEELRRLSEQTGLSLGETTRLLATFQSTLGPQGVMTAATAITQAQAGAGLMGQFQQLQAAALAQRAGPLYLPYLSDPFARFGISLFQPGSTPLRPRLMPTEDVLWQVARDLATRQLAGQTDLARLELAQLGPLVGGTDVLGRLAGRLERGARAGQSFEQTEAALRARRQPLFVPSDTDLTRLDRFHDALDSISSDFRELLAVLGMRLLPVFTSFLEGLDQGLRLVLGVARAMGQLLQPLAPLGEAITGLARVLGQLLIPGLAALGVVIIGALLPALAALVFGLSPVLGLLSGIAAVTAALVLGFKFLEGPFKAVAGLFSGWSGALKSIDWAGIAGTIKAWALAFWDAIATRVQPVVAWLMDTAWPFLRDKLSQAWTWTFSIALPAAWGVIQAALGWLKDTFWPWAADKLARAWSWTFEVALPALWATIQAALGWLKDTFWPWAADKLARAWSWVFDLALPAAWGVIQEALAWLKDTFWPWAAGVLAELWRWEWQIVGAILQPLWGTIQEALAWLKDTFWPWAAGVLAELWRWEWQIALPALWEATIKPALEFLREWWSWGANVLAELWRWEWQIALPALWREVVQPALTYLREWWSWGAGVLSEAWSWVFTVTLPFWRDEVEPALRWLKEQLWPWITSTVRAVTFSIAFTVPGFGSILEALDTLNKVRDVISWLLNNPAPALPSPPERGRTPSGGGSAGFDSGGSAGGVDVGGHTYHPVDDTSLPEIPGVGHVSWDEYNYWRNTGGQGAGPGAGQPFDAGATGALTWALGQLGSTRWAGLCEAFVEAAFGSRRFPDAKTAAQVELVSTDSWRDALPGALLFFRPDATNGWYGHVGLYLGGDQMISSLYTGVTKSALSDPYWSRLYLGWGLPAFASGGVIVRPLAALVGEAGPEAVLPLDGGGGRVLADALLPALAGEGGLGRGLGRGWGGPAVQITQHISIDALDFSDPTHVREMARRVGDQIMRDVRVLTFGMNLR